MNNWKLQIKSDKSDSAVVTKLNAIIPHCSQKMWVLISVGFENTGKAGSKTNTLTESTANFVGNLGWVSAISHTDMIRTLWKCNCRKREKKQRHLAFSRMSRWTKKDNKWRQHFIQWENETWSCMVREGKHFCVYSTWNTYISVKR